MGGRQRTSIFLEKKKELKEKKGKESQTK